MVTTTKFVSWLDFHVIRLDLINPELERADFEEGSAYISFMTDEVDLDTNYLESGDGVQVEEDKPVNKEGSTAMTTDDEPYKTWKGRNDG